MSSGAEAASGSAQQLLPEAALGSAQQLLPEATPQQTPQQRAAAKAAALNRELWTCEHCQEPNKPERTACNNCGKAKDQTKLEREQFEATIAALRAEAPLGPGQQLLLEALAAPSTQLVRKALVRAFRRPKAAAYQSCRIPSACLFEEEASGTGAAASSSADRTQYERGTSSSGSSEPAAADGLLTTAADCAGAFAAANALFKTARGRQPETQCRVRQQLLLTVMGAAEPGPRTSTMAEDGKECRRRTRRRTKGPDPYERSGADLPAEVDSAMPPAMPGAGAALAAEPGEKEASANECDSTTALPVAWLPLVLASSLPLLSGALPRDERGLCVIPHPHPLRRRRHSVGRPYLQPSGTIAYRTGRACDNCDKEIIERTWFACSAGCQVDFCVRCHTQLQKVFEGRDAGLATWAAQLVTSAASCTFRNLSREERWALAVEFAFEWPAAMFEQLVSTVADVANAQVVHLEDGEDEDVRKGTDFWLIVGFLELLRAANELPTRELRFGELALRGPRVPDEHFLLGAIDKCDAGAEWKRWRKVVCEGTLAPDLSVLESETFEISLHFALFLSHGSLVPIRFRQRCLLEDVHYARGERKPPFLAIEVERSPEAIRKAAVDALGKAEVNLARPLAVRFKGEPGEGPGVLREFLGLALKSLLMGCTVTGHADSEGGGEASSAGSGDGSFWAYDENLRTYWFKEPAQEGALEVFRACGALLGHAVLAETQLQAAFPRVLFAMLLRDLDSARVPTPGLAELASVQPTLARGLQELLGYEGEDVAEVFPLDWPRAAELTTQNRAEYVDRYVEWFFKDRFTAQFTSLSMAFQAVLGRSELLRRLVDAVQLEQIVCGAEVPLDVRTVRLNAEVTGWGQNDARYLEAFWQILENLGSAERRSFVVFASSCGRMPPQGWQGFVLRIQRNGDGDERLPTAYTCFNLLLLPRYSSPKVLEARLRQAIAETEGFGLN